MTALTIQPDHPQAGLGLQKCMDILKRMDVSVVVSVADS